MQSIKRKQNNPTANERQQNKPKHKPNNQKIHAVEQPQSAKDIINNPVQQTDKTTNPNQAKLKLYNTQPIKQIIVINHNTT